jgi:hypothetical protein
MENLKAVLINFWTARVLVIVGCIYGYKPIEVTFSHIGKIAHLKMAIPSLIGFFLARRYYYGAQ